MVEVEFGDFNHEPYGDPDVASVYVGVSLWEASATVRGGAFSSRFSRARGPAHATRSAGPVHAQKRQQPLERGDRHA